MIKWKYLPYFLQMRKFRKQCSWAMKPNRTSKTLFSCKNSDIFTKSHLSKSMPDSLLLHFTIELYGLNIRVGRFSFETCNAILVIDTSFIKMIYKKWNVGNKHLPLHQNRYINWLLCNMLFLLCNNDISKSSSGMEMPQWSVFCLKLLSVFVFCYRKDLNIINRLLIFWKEIFFLSE